MVSLSIILQASEKIEEIAGTGWELTPGNIIQWILIVGSGSTLLWGIIKNFMEKRKDEHQLKTSAYDQLSIENTKLIKDIKVLRKTADKFHILRELSLRSEEGQQNVIKTEQIADQTDSFEE